MKEELKTEEEPRAISVADFIRKINASLRSQSARVQGEVTSVSKGYVPQIYFTIKDKQEEALLDCKIWRDIYDQNGVELEVGDEVIITGTPEVFARRGIFSLRTQTIEYAGEGALRKAYEELNKKLSAEGLFAPERKRELPEYPRRIGIVTSKVGVVIQDFSSNLGRYGFKVTVVDSRVEGKAAIHDILASIKTLEKEDIEVLAIMRGGGSWESLQPFNTESVVRAIANFKYPVLTGIGHDTDVTLAEMVADVGVSTPTAVAEALNESWDQAHQKLERYSRGIISKYDFIISQTHSVLNSSTQRLNDVWYEIRDSYKEIENRLVAYLEKYSNRLKEINVTLSRTWKESLESPLSLALSNIGHRIEIAEQRINSENPERQLRLGYSITRIRGKIVKSIKAVKVNDEIGTLVSDGVIGSKVNKINKK